MAISDLQARNMKPGDKPMSDGASRGLRLEPGGAKGQGKWIFRFVSPVTGKRRDMGLGTYPDAGIAEARAKASDAREIIRSGRDPIDLRQAEKAARLREAAALNFEAAARQLHASLKEGWKNGNCGWDQQ